MTWYGIDQQQSDTQHHVVAHSRLTALPLPVETVDDGSKNEELDHRLLNAKLDVSVCQNRRYATKRSSS